jgi:phage-related protein
MKGVGDAIKAVAEGDAEKLKEALKGLAPEARKFVLEIQKWGKHFKFVQQAVQNRLFLGLSSHVKAVALSFRALAPGLVSITDGFNKAAKSFATWLTMPSTVDEIDQVLHQMALGMRALAPAATQFSAAMLDVAVVAAPMLRSAAEQASVLVTRFRDWINQARQSGELATILQNAVNTLKTLGSIAANVGKIFLAIGSAAGGGALTGLEQFTAAIANVLKSTAGQEGLASIFEAIQAVATSLGPSLAAAAQGLVPLGTILRDLAVTIGPGLEALIAGLSDGLRNLQPAAIPVGDALSEIGKAVGDLLPLVGRLLAAALKPLATILGGVVKAASPFLTVMGELLVGALEQILPAVQEIAEFLLPYLADGFRLVTDFVKPLIPLLIEVAKQFADGFVKGIKDWKPILDQIIPGLKDLGEFLLPIVLSGIKSAIPAAQIFGRILGWAAGLVGIVVTALVGFAAYLGELISAIKRAAGQIQKDWNKIKQATITAWNSIKTSIKEAINNAVSTVTGIKNRVQSALTGAGSWLKETGKKIIDGLINGIDDALGKLKKKLQAVTNLIPDWKGPMSVDAKLLTPTGRTIIESLLPGFDQGAEKVKRYLQGLTGELGGTEVSVTGAALQMPSGFVLQIGGREFAAVVVDAINDRRADVQTAVAGGKAINRNRG